MTSAAGFDLVPLDTKEKHRLDTNTGVDRALASVSKFEQALPEIQAMLDRQETDGAITLINKAMLATALAMIPIAEEQYRQKADKPFSENLIYAVNSAISSVRLLISDIDANRDRTLVATRIATHVLHPTFLLVAQQLISLLYRSKIRLVEAGVLDVNKTKEYDALMQETLLRPFSTFVEDCYKDATNKITTMVAV